MGNQMNICARRHQVNEMGHQMNYVYARQHQVNDLGNQMNIYSRQHQVNETPYEGPVSSANRQDNWFITRDVISHARDDGQKALKRSKAVTNLLGEKRDDLLPLTAGTKTTNRRRYRHHVTAKAKHGRMPPNIGQLSDEKESEIVMEVILTEEERRRLNEKEEHTEEDKRRQQRIKRLRKEEILECEKEKIDATAEEEKLLALIKTNEDTAPLTDRLDRLTEQELDDVIESIMKIDVG